VRRKPTELKRVEGTRRADRLNNREPRPPRGVPTLRRGAPAAVRREHAYLVNLLALMPGVATPADAVALELAAYALAEHHAAAAVVLREGATYQCQTQAGAVMYRSRPEVSVAADAWRRAHAALQTLGLSPASRPKIEVLPLAPSKSLEEFRRLRTGGA
jgi:P27 family predicted phage terminase small subunit